MQETIKTIMEAEQKASQIITEANKKTAEIISNADSKISERQKIFREKELERYNEQVKKEEEYGKKSLEELQSTNPNIDIDLDNVADEIIRRVLMTVFD